jgi:tRNA(Ile)-lysidine synthase
MRLDRAMKKERSFFSSAILPPARGAFLIGVSGGADSVALLHFLVARNYRLIVCHLDHGLRRSSRADARFVENLAVGFGYRFLSERISIREQTKRTGQSIETAGREVRFDFFARCATKVKCRRLVLAHQADDQVETFLARLFRGAGTAGLAAMRPRSERKIRGKTLGIFRPLLGVWRGEIEQYVGAHGLEFREDESNASLLHTRNRMRHQIIPLLEEYFGREIRENIWRTADVLAAEDEYLAAQIAAPGPQLAVRELRALPLALQRRTLRAWLTRHGISNIGFRDIESVRQLIALPAGPAAVNLVGDRQARRRAGALFIPRRSGRSLA